MPKESIEYVENIEKLGRKQLVIWPYHCIKGTSGNNLETTFSNLVYFFAVAKRSRTNVIVKGTDPASEMYGILKPEYSPTKYINIDFLDKIAKYQKIFIAGQAKSHCVYESVLQILEHYSNNLDVTERIYILEDCMSSIGGFEKSTEEGFEDFKNKYKINIIKSTDNIKW
jgi:nicotinamidase-related amidase